jgi:hypothetical protein
LSEDPKWKAGLLSSGLPLEYEAARLLASRGFRVEADFKHAWADDGVVKGFSVDLRARAHAPFSMPNQVSGTLDLVVECRHTRGEVSWLFLRDPNPPGGSAPVVGRTIRVVDQFSLCCVGAGATAAFEAGLPICCKGLEIDQATGRADDTEPGRGLVQLQYALPRLIVESVVLCFGHQCDRNVPLLFCPVLLTTAPLLVANQDLGVQEVERASALRELATEVPYLVTVWDYGPDFQAHCQREFKALERLERNDDLLMVETKRAALCRSQRELPLATIESLMAGDHYRLQEFFTRFIVCTRLGLPSLVEKIQEAAEAAVQSRKELQ